MAQNFNFQIISSDDEGYEGKARIALTGLASGGKTYSSLRLAIGLGGRTAVIDTENKTSLKYKGRFKEKDFIYDVIPLGEKDAKTGKRSYSPQAYIEAINFAEQNGYEVCIIDSLSHVWAGEGGELDMVQENTKKSKSGNSYIAWKDVTPWHNKLIDTILQSSMHIIATMRVKTHYKMTDEQGKRTKSPIKVGMEPIMRDGAMYEFDIVFDLDEDHNAVVSKTRCEDLDGLVFSPIEENVGQIIAEWLSGKPDPDKAPLPEDRVAYVRELGEKLGDDALKVVDTALKTRKVPGSTEYLTLDNLENNLITRLEAKVKALEEENKTSEETEKANQEDPEGDSK